MGKILYSVCALIVLVFALAGSVFAESCKTCNGKIEEGGKFSVRVPKVTGMESQAFDDIGCAVVSRNGECATRQSIFDSNAVVRDYITGEEIPAEKAYFVLKTGISTPAGYGIAAFKNKAEAEKFSAEHGQGKVVKWWELVDEKLK